MSGYPCSIHHIRKKKGELFLACQEDLRSYSFPRPYYSFDSEYALMQCSAQGGSYEVRFLGFSDFSFRFRKLCFSSREWGKHGLHITHVDLNGIPFKHQTQWRKTVKVCSFFPLKRLSISLPQERQDEALVIVE